MRISLVIVFFALLSCSNNENRLPYDWFHTETDRVEQWLNLQDKRYLNFKSITKLDSIQANHPLFSHDKFTKSIDSVLVGNTLFKINREGIFWSESESRPFIKSEDLGFTPHFLPTNYSEYLIVYGSVHYNDQHIVQVWDLNSKSMIHQYLTNDLRKSQATSSNLYYVINLNEREKWMKFNFESKLVQLLQFDNIHSLKVIDSSYFTTTSSKEINLISDLSDGDTFSINTEQLQNDYIFLVKKNNHLFFFENLPEQIKFYKSEMHKPNLHEVFSLNEILSVEDIQLIGDKAYLTFIKNGKNNFSIFDFSTNEYKRLLEDKLATLKFSSTPKRILSLSSFKEPKIKYEVNNQDSLVLVAETVNNKLFGYKVEQHWIQTKDDSLPIILYYKDQLYDAEPSVLVNVYGGFRKTVLPHYSKYINHFVEKGGVYIIAGVRGGGEKGILWHKSATGKSKINTFIDFENCLDYIGENITKPNKIAIYGGSNGGLVVNHAVVNYSEKFNVAVSMFGLSDMENFTSYHQPKWINEFGNPSKKEVTKYLKSYDPLARVKKLKNENLKLLLITGDKDDRVSPLNSYKFAYGLLEHENEVYLKVFNKVGHNFSGEILEELYNELYAFLFYHLGVDFN